MDDLYVELRDAAMSVSAADLTYLRRLGAINDGVIEMGLRHHQLGLMRVAEAGDGLFYPSPDGARRLVVPVYEGSELLDLVAFSTTSPDHWLLRTGFGLALGLFEGWEPHRWADSVHLYRTPLDWLRAGGDGLCVVDWSAPEIYMLNDLRQITVNDHHVRQQLINALQRPLRIMPISLVEETRLAA